MQCKDIPDRPILEMLARNPEKWHNWYFGNEFDVTKAMPPGTCEKLRLAKMRILMRRGLVSGCSCGCRGDFVITEKGKEHLILSVGMFRFESHDRKIVVVGHVSDFEFGSSMGKTSELERMLLTGRMLQRLTLPITLLDHVRPELPTIDVHALTAEMGMNERVNILLPEKSQPPVRPKEFGMSRRRNR